MTVKELINQLTENFDPTDCVKIDGDCLRISSEVCDALIKMETVDDD